jgi:hypothetical protein
VPEVSPYVVAKYASLHRAAGSRVSSAPTCAPAVAELCRSLVQVRRVLLGSLPAGSGSWLLGVGVGASMDAGAGSGVSAASGALSSSLLRGRKVCICLCEQRLVGARCSALEARRSRDCRATQSPAGIDNTERLATAMSVAVAPLVRVYPCDFRSNAKTHALAAVLCARAACMTSGFGGGGGGGGGAGRFGGDLAR